MWEDVEGMCAIFGSDFVVSESSATLRAQGAVMSFFFDSHTVSVACPWLTRDQCVLVAAAALEQQRRSNGSSLFELQDAILSSLPPPPAEKTARVREEEEDLSDVRWELSQPLKDRKSRFLGFACAISSAEEGRRFGRAVRARGGVADATHVILAWRTAEGACERDDDGEGGAGDALLEMLERQGGAGRAVAVARWYGGVKLGGDRFRHIVAVAKEALLQL